MTTAPRRGTLTHKIDLEPARKFIRALRNTRTDEADPPVVFQTVDDHKAKPGTKEHSRYTNVFTGTLKDCANGLIALNLERAGIFLKINAGGRKKAETTHPLALFVDFDAKDPVTGNYDPLLATPTTQALRPNAIIGTSPISAPNKMHFYWFLKNPETISLDDWEKAMRHLAYAFGGDVGVATRERTMRLPGFYHNKPGKPPERSVLHELHRGPRYTLEEVVRAFPLPKGKTLSDFETNKPRKDGALRNTPRNGVHTADVPPARDLVDEDQGFEIDIAANIDADDGSTPPKSKRADFDATKDHTEQSLRSYQSLIAWLDRRKVGYLTSALKPRVIKLERCPFNPDHQDAQIEVFDSGAFGARCFHESCGSNRQIWNALRDRIGGWRELQRGDHAELADKLLDDVRGPIPEPLISDAGSLYRYNYETGVWDAIPDYLLEKRVAAMAGRRVGDRGRPLRISNRDVTGVVRTAHTKANEPGFFDNGTMGCAFTNGFLVFDEDKKSVELEPHSAGHRARHGYAFPLAEIDYAKEAPRWISFLDEIFEGDDDRREKIAVLQEFLGACLLGIAPRFAAAMFMVGDGSNGKSVVIKVFKELFPRTAVSAVRPQDLKHEYARARLAGVHLNIVSEVPERDIFDSASFKAVLDGSPIDARHPYGRAFTFQPTAGHLYACNRLPGSGDHTHGFWRRVLVLGFNRQFSEAERDVDLDRRLVRTELAWIALWGIEGARRLVRQGKFTEVETSNALKHEWKTMSNPILAWIEEECEPVSISRGKTTAELFAAYVAWCRASNHTPLSKLSFTQRLAHLKIENVRHRPMEGGKQRDEKRWALSAPEAFVFN